MPTMPALSLRARLYLAAILDLFSRFVEPPGHTRESSLSANPARTLSRLSCRVRSLHPMIQNSDVAPSAKRDHLGSHARKHSVSMDPRAKSRRKSASTK